MSTAVARVALSRLANAAARSSSVLLRLAYLSVTNAFAVLRLLPMSDRDRDVEKLALRHQVTVPERQLVDDGRRSQEGKRGIGRHG